MSCMISLEMAHCKTFDTLGVDDRRSWRSVTAVHLSQPATQQVVDRLRRAVLLPLGIVVTELAPQRIAGVGVPTRPRDTRVSRGIIRR